MDEQIFRLEVSSWGGTVFFCCVNQQPLFAHIQTGILLIQPNRFLSASLLLVLLFLPLRPVCRDRGITYIEPYVSRGPSVPVPRSDEQESSGGS